MRLIKTFHPTIKCSGVSRLAPRGVLVSLLAIACSVVPALAQSDLSAGQTLGTAVRNRGHVIEAASAAACTSTTITPYIYTNGAWAEESTASVASGASVDIGPQPVTGGSWSWSGPNGYSSTAREIDNIPLSSGTNTYTATYTNASGCKSTQVFTITVGSGSSCTPTAITPYIYANGVWAEETSASVASGATVDIGPQPVTGGSWSWSGPNGYSSTAREIDSIPLSTGTNTFTATYTNTSNCKSTETFTITVSGSGGGGGGGTCGTNYLPVNGSCGYIKGANLAWLDGLYNTWLGEDPHEPSYGIGYNSTDMNNALATMHSLGIKVVRVWIFEGDMGCNLDSNGYVTSVTPTFWANLDNAVQLAHNNGIALYLTLNNGRADFQENSAMLTAFINNALIPLVNRYKGNPGVWAIDEMNEIDGTVAGSTGNYTSTGSTWAQAEAYIRTVSSAIHGADSSRLVSCSTGWHTWTNIQNFKGLGLDFYDFHVYADNGYVPTAASLGMDKPIYMGESGQGTDTWSDSLQQTAEANFLSNTHSGGYAGVGIWDYGYNSGNESDIYQMHETNGSLRPVASTIESFNP